MAEFKSTVIPQRSVKINGTIKMAVGEYREKKVPMRQLLTDFLAVKSKGDQLAEALNPWAYQYGGIEGHEIERGVSVLETLFIFSAMSLKKERPTDVINAALYSNKSRNDSAFECGYVLPIFLNMIKNGDKVLVINPSPDLITEIEKSRPDQVNNYATIEKTVASLYQIQFPRSVFKSFDEAEQFQNVNTVLLLNRDQKIQESKALLSCLQGCEDNARVIALVPSRWFDCYDSGAYKLLQDMGFSPEAILVVDNKATVSTPKKKLLIVFDKNERSTFSLWSSSYDSVTGSFEIDDRVFNVNTDHYFRSQKTILSIWKSETNPKGEKTSPLYKKPAEYDFSREITLFYKIYDNRKGRNAGIVNYRELKDSDLKIYGKKISGDIEKGLRHETKEGVLTALEGIAFDDDLYPIIRNDIEKNYINQNNEVSLKTLWYYCWVYLEPSRKYDHEYLQNLMSAGLGIGDINPYEKNGNDMLERIALGLGVAVGDIPFKAIEQISMILDSAVNHRVLSINPLVPYVMEYARRATERQQDVRNALVKKHFSDREELSIFKAIIEPIKVDDNMLPKCVVKSIWLSAAIRMFTGMAIREVAALCWNDYKTTEELGGKQLLVTKFVDRKGKLILHAERDNWKRFRIIPVAHVLAKLLDKRKQYLIDQGINEDYLNECPIILAEERLSDMKQGRKTSHCKPDKISAVCNAVIRKADIPENSVVLPDDKNDLVTDFNRYHGDIFLSNFRHKANHKAFLSMGEINYMIGINPPDTFSEHYCDYTNDLLQIGIIQKLERWVLNYERILESNRLKQPKQNSIDGAFSLVSGPFKEGIAAVDLMIDNNAVETIDIIAESEHGVTVRKMEY